MSRILSSLAALLLAAPLLAQDVITAGSIHAEAGGAVTVPVSIRDSSSTPLGVNLSADKRIQAIAFKVTASPASAVTSVDFEPAGVLQNIEPLYERIVDGADSAAYIGSFSMNAAAIPFTLGATAPGDRIGSLLVTLAPGLADGTKVALTFHLTLTALSNQQGTIVESAYDRKLKLVSGAITIGGTPTTTTLASSLNPSEQGNAVTFTATVSPAGAGTMLFRNGNAVLGTAKVAAGVATLTTSALPAGTHSIRAFYEGTGGSRSSTSAALTQTVNAPPVNPPASIVATAASATSVLVTWPAVPNAVSYEISRRSNGGPFEVAGTSNNTSFTDGARTAGTTYLYVVRAVANGGGKSSPSPSDTATTVVFTDDPVTPAVRIKRTHINELRTAVNAYRATAGLAAAVFTDPTLTTTTLVRRVHFDELRAALQAARTAYGLPALSFTDPILTGLKVKAVHLQELRTAVK
ncbi:MAG TPA: Ig-like domain repeat protein [Thermoanaerobaculia bacterium]|jgi:hypothetical protein